MIFTWETKEERLKRYMQVPPIKRLEWLQKMHEFTRLTSSKETKKIRKKLRGI